MTQSDLAKLACLTVPELHYIVKGRSIDEVLRFRREIQVAMASRRKRISLEESKTDPALQGGLGATMQLERWARQAAYVQELPNILRRSPELLNKSKQAAKIEFKKWWEDYVRRMSY